MGLHMNERKAVTRETRGAHLKANKKEKGLILINMSGSPDITGSTLVGSSQRLPPKPQRLSLTGNPLVSMREKSRNRKTAWANLSTRRTPSPASKPFGRINA
jgi:hypothetical protein